MDITTLAIGYLLTSAICSSVLVGACMLNGRTKDPTNKKKRVVRVVRSGGTWHCVDTASHAR
jgi:hypothetical protein